MKEIHLTLECYGSDDWAVYSPDDDCSERGNVAQTIQAIKKRMERTAIDQTMQDVKDAIDARFTDNEMNFYNVLLLVWKANPDIRLCEAYKIVEIVLQQYEDVKAGRLKNW